jgi:hypothetical protein
MKNNLSQLKNYLNDNDDEIERKSSLTINIQDFNMYIFHIYKFIKKLKGVYVTSAWIL